MSVAFVQVMDLVSVPPGGVRNADAGLVLDLDGLGADAGAVDALIRSVFRRPEQRD
jgi:hypothetical protein